MFVFENILKMPKYDNFVMILVLVKNAYRVFVFENTSKSVLEKDVLKNVRKRLKVFYPYSKSLVLFSPSFR